MSFVWAGLVVIGFALMVQRLRLPSRARQVGGYLHDTVRILTDRQLDDRTKERLLRQHAGHFFLIGTIILLGGCAALGIPIGVIWVMERFGLASLPEVVSVLQRPDFLVVISLVGGMAYGVFKIRNRT